MTFTKRPLCPYCNAEWTDEMMKIEAEEGSSGCETCGPGATEIVVDITCHKCGKLIYRKEGYSYDFD